MEAIKTTKKEAGEIFAETLKARCGEKSLDPMVLLAIFESMTDFASLQSKAFAEWKAKNNYILVSKEPIKFAKLFDEKVHKTLDEVYNEFLKSQL